MNPLRSLLLSLSTLIPLALGGLAVAGLLSACASGLVPNAVALALEPSRATPDAAATRAVATFDAALQAPAVFAARPSATPVPTATMSPTLAPSLTPSPVPTLSPTPTATATRRPAATPPPTPTPNLAATAVALQRQIDTAVAATLAARPTAVVPPPQPAPSQPFLRDSELEPATPAGTAPAADSAQIVGMLGTVDAGEDGGLVNLRTGPGTNSPVMLGVDSGQRVLVLARNQAATWLYIRTADGVTGWMSADYVVTGQPVESYPIQ
jgi:hypothetical protein